MEFEELVHGQGAGARTAPRLSACHCSRNYQDRTGARRSGEESLGYVGEDSQEPKALMIIDRMEGWLNGVKRMHGRVWRRIGL